ncbi:aminoglycoside phosphotransferase family protein [Nocardioides mangrovicus]|uniref:Aminoglycoside phosphotransferase family protein n=2 Tax=Nocardioides mangrovicus TaxID=2478913 RepID=A0A3L8P378_9ACTN|nr:aminoglycoside phosphotransferase family protein [Nocardioides mangrovicus]
MHQAAIDWAADHLSSPLRSVEPLAGGMTSTMLALTTLDGEEAVLRLITREPWRRHGADLARRERAAMVTLAAGPVPAPRSLALDADGSTTGVSAHLMTRVPGRPTDEVDEGTVDQMAALLGTIHQHRPPEPFRPFQSWAWEAKWVVPPWTRHPQAWRAAFSILAGPAPSFRPTFLHRDYGHRNLLWTGGLVTGVVDWVETSTGPVWLDAAHAATNLVVGHDASWARAFLTAYAALTDEPLADYWLVMDAVGFLPPPGQEPMFADPAALARLDDWVARIVG